MKHYTIIGNGVAAAGCIEGIRSVDTQGRITVISEESHPVYCRPLISYCLEKKTSLDRMGYREEDFYETNGCEVLYGSVATSIHPAEQTVVVDDGTSLAYDALCVATGSAPFIPSFDGIDSVEKKFSFMTLDDMLNLERAINKNSKVLIVGAGLIGLKCAEGIRERVAEITVCDLAPHILSSILDTASAAIVQDTLESQRINFMLGDSVAKFEKNTAHMNSGTTLNFDVLVLAVGVRANTSLVAQAGGEVDRGIIVNERLETSLSGVYSAGDCTMGDDISFGQKRVLALLPNAYMQGFTAGVNMAGGKAVFDNAIPMNATGFFGLHTMTAGSYDGDMYEERSENGIKRLFTREGRLVGFILIGDTDRAGIYTSLIREKTPLDSINFELLKKVATTNAFAADRRKQKFGEAV